VTVRRPADEPDRSVVIVPGLSGRASEDFAFLRPMLEREFEVVPVEVPPGRLPGTLDDLVDLVGAAVRRCSMTPTLVGYSIGAVSAAAFAAAHPFEVQSLALVAGWVEPAAKLRAFAELWAHSSDADELARAAELVLFSAGGWESARPPKVDALSRQLVRLSASSGLTDIVELIRQPTLVIGCSHDEVASAGQSKLLFGAIPDARYIELTSGHALVHERPAELLRAIVDFVRAPVGFAAGSLIGEDRP
jgi:pimeloyl-ACP methyl ester carboxylesterase